MTEPKIPVNPEEDGHPKLQVSQIFPEGSPKQRSATLIQDTGLTINRPNSEEKAESLKHSNTLTPEQILEGDASSPHKKSFSLFPEYNKSPQDNSQVITSLQTLMQLFNLELVYIYIYSICKI